MKKYLILFMSILFLISGCGNVSKEDIINKFEKNIKNTSYELVGTMNIYSNEESFEYGLKVQAYKNKLYKVSLVNKNNDHEQILLKNNEGVYVITPSLNKSFKFQSNWPNNGSQAYILESILNDIKNDQDNVVEEKDDNYLIKSKVLYSNNSEMAYQKVLLTKDGYIKEIKVFDKNDVNKITVVVDKCTFKAKYSEEDFELKEIIDITNDCSSEECSEKTTGNIIEDVIYPLYIPSNTYLSSSDKIDTDTGNRVILTFSGDKDFVLVEEVSKASPNFEIIPVYGDPELISTSVAALGNNSMYFSIDNVDYYLASSSLSNEEMLNIASSLGNSVVVAKSK